MIISIDGPAGSGKSTIAEILSQKLGFIHFNSGSLYRGITAHILNSNLDLNANSIPNLKLKTSYQGGKQYVFVNNIDYTPLLRDNEVSIATPAISQFPKIRKIVDACQRKFAKTHNVVIDGRDIGSYVFPNAEFKFYLDCDIHERAKRRFEEEKLKNKKITIKEIEKQILERDEIDKNKKVAPLVVPENAIIIDSTNISIDEVVNQILSIIKKAKKI